MWHCEGNTDTLQALLPEMGMGQILDHAKTWASMPSASVNLCPAQGVVSRCRIRVMIHITKVWWGYLYNLYICQLVTGTTLTKSSDDLVVFNAFPIQGHIKTLLPQRSKRVSLHQSLFWTMMASIFPSQSIDCAAHPLLSAPSFEVKWLKWL